MGRAQSDNTGPARAHIRADFALESLHAYLKQVVSVHHVMFEKLLFQHHTVRPELARLFEDVGRSYLDIARDIERHYDARGSRLNNILKPES
jgi:hypothetical protein